MWFIDGLYNVEFDLVHGWKYINSTAQTRVFWRWCMSCGCLLQRVALGGMGLGAARRVSATTGEAATLWAATVPVPRDGWGPHATRRTVSTHTHTHTLYYCLVWKLWHDLIQNPLPLYGQLLILSLHSFFPTLPLPSSVHLSLFTSSLPCFPLLALLPASPLTILPPSRDTDEWSKYACGLFTY